MKKNKCSKCEILISNNAKHCRSCSHIIDGRTFRKYYCKDCDKKVSRFSGYYGKGRCVSCSKKGKNHPNYEKRRPKHSKWMKNHNPFKNKSHTKEFRQKQSKKMKKILSNSKNHWNWQGGKSTLANFIRNLNENKDWRNKIFGRDNYTCQECSQIGGYLEAHHIKEFHILLAEFLKEYNQFSPIEDKETLIRLAMNWRPFWEVSNGKTLCKKCHLIMRGNSYVKQD